MDPDAALTRMNNAAAALSEHFDSVEIIATRLDRDGTVMCHAGRGNWYARYGSVREWMLKQNERSRETIRHENDD